MVGCVQGKLDPMIGRKQEMDRVTQILLKRRKNNPCLVGDPGVGKTVIVEGLAQSIADGSVPPKLSGCKVFYVSHCKCLLGSVIDDTDRVTCDVFRCFPWKWEG